MEEVANQISTDLKALGFPQQLVDAIVAFLNQIVETFAAAIRNIS